MEFVKYVIGTLCGGGLLTFILALLQRSWAKKDKREAKEENNAEAALKRVEDKLDKVVEAQTIVSDAQKVIMVERIRYLGLCYIGQKRIDIFDKEQIKKMHKSYKALGGNGDLDTVMDEIEKLPVVDN